MISPSYGIYHEPSSIVWTKIYCVYVFSLNTTNTQSQEILENLVFGAMNEVQRILPVTSIMGQSREVAENQIKRGREMLGILVLEVKGRSRKGMIFCDFNA